LLTLSFIDSSPLFFPFGNDIFMIAITARHHRLLVYFAAMAAAGSVLGTLTVDMLSREGGEKAFEKTVSPNRFNYIKNRVTKRAEWALILAALMPPPFPYTGFVAGAAAFQYPRKKLLTVVFFTRFARFLIDGVLAIVFGRRILQLAQSRVFDVGMIVLMVLCVGVSIFAIVELVKNSRRATAMA